MTRSGRTRSARRNVRRTFQRATGDEPEASSISAAFRATSDRFLRLPRIAVLGGQSQRFEQHVDRAGILPPREARELADGRPLVAIAGKEIGQCPATIGADVPQRCGEAGFFAGRVATDQRHGEVLAAPLLQHGLHFAVAQQHQCCDNDLGGHLIWTHALDGWRSNAVASVRGAVSSREDQDSRQNVSLRARIVEAAWEQLTRKWATTHAYERSANLGGTSRLGCDRSEQPVSCCLVRARRHRAAGPAEHGEVGGGFTSIEDGGELIVDIRRNPNFGPRQQPHPRIGRAERSLHLVPHAPTQRRLNTPGTTWAMLGTRDHSVVGPTVGAEHLWAASRRS